MKSWGFTVSLNTLLKYLKSWNSLQNKLLISESGFKDKKILKKLKWNRINNYLIGESLVKSNSIKECFQNYKINIEFIDFYICNYNRTFIEQKSLGFVLCLQKTKKFTDLHQREVEKWWCITFLWRNEESLNLKSKSGIHRLISALEERGFKKIAHKARALEVVKLPENAGVKIYIIILQV